MEKAVAELIRHTTDEIDHVLVCLTEGGQSTRLLPSGIELLELGKRPGNSFPFLERLASLMRRLRPCVVHTRNWPGLDGLIAARLAGIRRVVHGEHGLGSDDPTGLDPRRLRVRRALRSCPREYTCVPRSLETWLQESIRIRRPVTRIANGVDINLYRAGRGAAIRRELGIDEGSIVVGVVGRLNRIKDHDTLLSAYAKVHSANSRVKLLVVGDGPERERLRASSPSGVRFLGDRDDVPDLLRAFDVFVLPSRNERISNTILEEMASGIPVVATRVGGNPELVELGQTGFLLPAGDAPALTDALLTYAQSQERRAPRGANGRLRAEISFSVSSMVAAYREVWERVLKKVLIYSSLFPSPRQPLQGLFVSELAMALTSHLEVRVVKPVLVHQAPVELTKKMRRYTHVDAIPVEAPLILNIPRYLKCTDARLMALGSRRAFFRATEGWADLVHAHFAYPDASAVARLASSRKLPLVVAVHGSDLNVLAIVPERRVRVQGALQSASAVIAVAQDLARKVVALACRKTAFTTSLMASTWRNSPRGPC